MFLRMRVGKAHVQVVIKIMAECPSPRSSPPSKKRHISLSLKNRRRLLPLTKSDSSSRFADPVDAAVIQEAAKGVVQTITIRIMSGL